MQVLRGVPIKICCDCGHRRTLIPNLNPGQGNRLNRIQRRNDCNRAFGNRPWHETIAIETRASNTKEEVTGRDLPGIVRETKNLRVKVTTHTAGFQAGDQLTQSHKSEEFETSADKPPIARIT
jgi:hypothetical protein